MKMPYPVCQGSGADHNGGTDLSTNEVLGPLYADKQNPLMCAKCAAAVGMSLDNKLEAPSK